MAVGIQIKNLNRDVTGLVTVSCYDGHGFLVGDKVRLYNVMGGGTYPFMASNPYTVTRITAPLIDSGVIIKPSSSFDYEQAGATQVANVTGTATISAGTPYGSSNQFYILTTSTAHGFTTQPALKIKGVTSSVLSSTLLGFINNEFSTTDIQVYSTTQLIVRLHRQYIGNPSITWTTGRIETYPTGMTVAFDDGIRGGGNIGGLSITSIASRTKNKTEAQTVAAIVNLAQNSKGVDYPFLRLFNPMDVSQIGKASTPLLRARISTQASTLRSALDLVIESFQQKDLIPRRYYINQDGQFVYEIVEDVKPATATAPYKIVTSDAGTPNTSAAAASVAPYSLEVGLDHDGTKRALFRGANSAEGPIADLIKFDSPDAMGTAYTRVGSPYFDEVVDYPNGGSISGPMRRQAARSLFVERSAPVQSISFTLRGAGTASWNSLGFVAGYAQVTPLTNATTDIGYYANFDGIVASGGTVTVRTWPLANGAIPGMAIVVRGISTAGFSGTFSVAGTAADGQYLPYSFTYLSATAASQPASRISGDDVSVTVYGVFVRTGIAPNQIVTVTLPTQHKLATGAVVTVSGLTGAAGTSMNASGTATVVDAYSFTYPSTGTNGTATGIGVISAITLVPRWSGGQWVDITAAELGLTGLYRVEQVDWGFEPGSFTQTVKVTVNRRATKTITKLMRSQLR